MGLVSWLPEAGLGWEGPPRLPSTAVQSDWRDQDPHPPSLGVQGKEDECEMGHPESFLEEGMGLAGKI